MKTIGLVPKMLNIGLAASLAFGGGECEHPIVQEQDGHRIPLTSESIPDESNGWQRIQASNIQRNDILPIEADIIHKDKLIGQIGVDDAGILDDQTLKKRFPGSKRSDLHDIKMQLKDFDESEIHLIGLKTDMLTYLDDQSLSYWAGLTDPYFIESFKKSLQTELNFPGKKIYITVLFTPQTLAIANPSALNIDENSVSFIVNFKPNSLKADSIIGNLDIATHEALHTYFLPNDKIPSTINESLANLAGRSVYANFARLSGVDLFPDEYKSNYMFRFLAEVRDEAGTYVPNTDDACNLAVKNGVPVDYCIASAYEINLSAFNSLVSEGVFPYSAYLYKGRMISLESGWNLEGRLLNENNTKRFLSQYEINSVYLYLSLLSEGEKNKLLNLSSEEGFETLVNISSQISDPQNELFRFNLQANEQAFLKHVYEIAGLIPANAMLSIEQITSFIRYYYPDGTMDGYAWYVKLAHENNLIRMQNPSTFPLYESSLTLNKNNGVYRTKIAKPLLTKLTSSEGDLDIQYILPSIDALIQKQRADARNVVINYGYKAEVLKAALYIIDQAKEPYMSYFVQSRDEPWRAIPKNEELNLNNFFTNTQEINIMFVVHGNESVFYFPSEGFINPWKLTNLKIFDMQVNVKDGNGLEIPLNSELFRSAVEQNQATILNNHNNQLDQIDLAKRSAQIIEATPVVDTISFDFSEDPLKPDTKKVYLPLIKK